MEFVQFVCYHLHYFGYNPGNIQCPVYKRSTKICWQKLISLNCLLLCDR